MAFFKIDVVSCPSTGIIRQSDMFFTVDTNVGKINIVLSEGEHDGSNAKLIMFKRSSKLPITLDNIIKNTMGHKFLCAVVSSDMTHNEEEEFKNSISKLRQHKLPLFNMHPDCRDLDRVIQEMLRQLTGHNDLVVF